MGNVVEIFRQRIWLGPLIGLIVGLALGLLMGWVIVPVTWTPGASDVAAAADSFSLNADVNLAKSRLAGLSKSDLERITNELIAERQKRNLPIEADRLTAFAQALGLQIKPPAPGTAATSVPSGQPTPRPAATPPTGGLDPLILIVVGIFIIGLLALAGVIFVRRILPTMRARRAAPRTAAEGGAPAVSPATPIAAADVPATTAAMGGLGRFVPSYTLGNDNYDTSYSLETPRGEFLGECGMGISERIGEGKPDKVTAFDLWLFDKADVRTVTQILMTDYAFKDQTLRAKLATKGEAVLAEKGKVLRLETQSLGITAHIVELIYATNPNFPPNSHFQKLIIEIVPEFKNVPVMR